MPARVYVLGHRNPDTDAIASTIGYASLLKLQGRDEVVAGRLGPLRPETQYLLDRFGVPVPELISNVRPRVGDVMTSPAVTARVGESLFEIRQKLQKLGMRSLPVVDDDGVLRGSAEPRDFARMFFNGLFQDFDEEMSPNLDAIIHATGGTVLASADRRHYHRVVVATMSVESLLARISPDVIVVVGDRAEVHYAAVEHSVGALIVSGGYPVDSALIARAARRGTAIVSVPYNTFRTVQLINLSIPIESVMRRDPPVCSADDFIEDVRGTLSTVRALAVLDADDRVVGVVTRADLLRASRRKVVLVDHNERGHSVAGIETAEIVGIVDHHRVADLQTALPPLMRVEPVGACSTLVAKLYGEAGVEIPRAICGVLLGGIVADTLLFRSPTVTPIDRKIAAELAARVDADPAELGKAILDIASDLAGRSAEELIATDFKEFHINGARFGVAVLETTNAAALADRRQELLKALEQKQSSGYWSVLLVVVDVFHERTLVLICGHGEEVAAAFRSPLKGGCALELPGVYSRKKQIVPVLNEIQPT